MNLCKSNVLIVAPVVKLRLSIGDLLTVLKELEQRKYPFQKRVVMLDNREDLLGNRFLILYYSER